MSIAKNAVNESKAVARLAVDAAKNELIESLTPRIKEIIDGQLRRGSLSEDADRLLQTEDHDGIEEGKDMSRNSKNKVESVASLFPGINEMADEPVEESALEEADSEDEMAYEAKDPAEDDMNETLELSESELESIYREALQLEVDVKKGFSDMSKPHEFGAGAKGQYQSDPANLADYASGEKEWDDVEPPAKKK